MSIDAAAFKKGMRHLAASVTLITTRHDGLRGGLTATAVCSVSAEPPQILVCVNRTASAHDTIGQARIFCVNILAPEHRKIAERFAAYAKEDPAATAGQDLNSPSRSPRRRILSMLRR